MAKRKKEWFEAKATLVCTICDKDIEFGDRYRLNDTGEPMHYLNPAIRVQKEKLFL